MNFARKVQILLWKEVKSELRAKEMISAMLVFSLLVVAVFGFALPSDRELVKQVFPGILWVTLTFAGILGLNRSFVSEKQNDCIYGLMLCPMDRAAIYCAKTIMNLLLMLIVELITIPLFFVMFNLTAPPNLSLFLLVLAVGTFGFMSVGTFLSALAANTRSSEVLLPILMIPMIVPILISAVQADKIILAGGGFLELKIFFNLLIVFAVVFTVVPLLLFDYLLEV